MFEVIDNAFALGHKHSIEGTLREDFGLIATSKEKESFFRIFAVADGHGDSNCPRSHIGSKVACEKAVSALESFCRDIAENRLEADVIKEGSHGPAQQERINQGNLVRRLIAHIVSEWQTSVNSDFNEHPLTEDERAGCSRYLEYYDRSERIEHIYGTTLIAGLLTDSYLLLMQQGDGRCDVFDAKGRVSQPIPWDDRCFANITTSLCDTDAIWSFRYCVIDIVSNPIIACIADSDGVEDCFATIDLLQKYHRELLVSAAEFGVESLIARLLATLPEMSKKGSQDDITICGFWDIEKIRPLVPDFKRMNEQVRIESEILNLESRLKSMDSMGKMEALRERFEKAAKAEDGKETAEQEYRAYQDKKSTLIAERESLIEELKRLGDAERETVIEVSDVSMPSSAEKDA